ncbi:thiamine-monophosphate kinase ThiL [methanogenic archaeon ISO4-H5]|nr:thiamine-monophosphate kinase ThiL [methanogenic archaeon ISO4-H5]MEE3363356.1 thiamine-phosphate kinase [Methanomethylophilus sp.]
MSSLKDVGERQLVETVRSIIRPRSKSTVIGPGDDAAVIRNPSGDIVVSSDVVTKERHLPETMTYEQFGWTAAAVNFSDIASMGARPLGFLPAVTIPEDEDESVLYDIMSGIDQCCEFCNTEVVGGDTKFGSLAVAGTALGTMEGRKPMTRRGAQPGDIVAVTGMLGGPAAGYYAIKNGFEAEDQVFSLMVPVPHVEDGIKLSGTGAIHSCMDLSDGLANAATEICKQSHVGMEIEWEFLPIDDEVKDILEASHADLRDTVTRWGGEYELLFTLDRGDLQKLYDAGIAFSIIGLVTNGEGPVLNDGDERKVMENGIY